MESTSAGLDRSGLEAWFDERTAANEFSGHALAWNGGAPIFSYAGGLAHRGHGVPIRDDTRFGVASITKMVTAIAALQLVDRGLLRLDQPLVDVLPPGQRPTAMTREHTLHHLLSHTSGLANYHDDNDETLTSFLANWDRLPVYHVRRAADMVPLFRDLPAVAAPGTEVAYNDAAFILAGLVIEAVTGRAWDEIVTTNVFQPAGMTDTGLEHLDQDPDRLAVGYYSEDLPPEARQTNIYSVPAAPMPDGGMITTTADLARLVDALLAGRLLPDELVAAMTRPQGPASDEVEQWGYGCQLTVSGGHVVAIGHGGSDKGVAGLLTHFLDEATTIVVLCNRDRGAFASTLQIAAALGIEDPRATA
ncbi:MAG TPA: serine hydrolase domain-containing protein [Candidatus Limnocylindrales bacterium]|nr:serine hydrolase domain-containing protein [Candidatus Limnocylindrales bacterium]